MAASRRVRIRRTLSRTVKEATTPRLAGLWLAVLRRDRAEWRVVLAAWLLLTCATTLLAASAVYGDSAATGSLRTSLRLAAPGTTVVRVLTTQSQAHIDGLDARVAPVVRRSLDASGSAALVAFTDGLSFEGVAPSDATRQVEVGTVADLARHARLVAGQWPRAGSDPAEGVVSEGASQALGLQVGSTIRLTSKLDGKTRGSVRIVGIDRPDPTDPFWLGDALALRGVRIVGSATIRGPIIVEPTDLERLIGQGGVNLEWRWVPVIDALDPQSSESLRTAIGRLQVSVQTALGGAYVRVDTPLPELIAAAGRSRLVAESGVILLGAQLAVLAGYAILLVAGLLTERRRAEAALLRARGATTAQLAALSVGEALLLAIPAAAVAPFLAVALIRLLGAAAPLVASRTLGPVEPTTAAFIIAAAAGVASVIVLTLPALPAPASLAGVRAALSRQMGGTMAQRLGLDLALVIAAGLALWQLQLYGSSLVRDVHGNFGIDPLLVAAPAIGLLAGAIVGARGLPRAAEFGEWLLSRRRGLVPPLLARQIARRPLRYTRTAVLLTLAAALGTFAATYVATWSASQHDQAAYQAAADVRARVPNYPSLDDWVRGSAYRAVPGVMAATPVISGDLEAGRAIPRATLLALDPARITAAGAAGGNEGSGATTDAAVADALRVLAGRRAGGAAGAPFATLSGTPRALRLTIDATLASALPAPSPAAHIEAAAVVLDADGLHRVPGTGRAQISGTNEHVEIPLVAARNGAEYTPSYPLRLVAVELTVSADGFVELGGSIEIRTIETADAAGGWHATPLPAAGWSWARIARQEATPIDADPNAAARIQIGGGGGGSGGGQLTLTPPGNAAAVYRYGATVDDTAIAAVAGDRFVALAGARTGDTVAASMSGYAMTLVVAGSTRLFPPLDPTAPFVVVDRDTLSLGLYQRYGLVLTPSEWWLSVAPGQETVVADAVAAAPLSAVGVVTRAGLAETLSADPIALAVIGALGLGVVAAIIVAAIGFLLGAASNARERLPEFAVLRAVGLPASAIGRVLALEQAFLLGFGALAGVALGLLLAVATLPFAALNSTGAATVPPPTVVVPWQAIVPLAAGAALLLGAAALGLVRSAAGIDLAEMLRGREDAA